MYVWVVAREYEYGPGDLQEASDVNNPVFTHAADYITL